MTRETKAGLLMIMMLAGVFGFMVYKRLHQPAAAMAQQGPVESQTEGPGGEETPTQSEDPFEATPQRGVVTASAAVPAQIPDDEGATNISQTSSSPKNNSKGADPFEEFDVAITAVKTKLPTNIPDDIEERPTTNRTQNAKAVAATESGSTSADNFDPFDAQTVSSQKAPTQPQARADAAVVNSDPFELEEPIKVSAKASSAVPKAEPEFDLDQASDPFEKPVDIKQFPAEKARATARDSFPSETFESSNDLEVQRPAVAAPVKAVLPPATAKQTSASNDPFDSQDTFEPTKKSVPGAALEPRIEEAFDQPAKTSSVPALTIPSRDSFPTNERPAPANDDKFGGFRPAAVHETAAKALPPEDRQTVPTITAETPARRVARPAPVAQIDEDFGAKPARPLIAGDTYQIEPSDNFWTISRKKYGTGRYFMALAQHNSQVIPDPQRMRPGVTVSTPAAEVLERTYPTLIPKAATIDPVQTASVSPVASIPTTRPAELEEDAGFFAGADGVPMYRVGKEDTLSGIAQRHLGRSSRWVQVFELNRDVLTDGNTLKIGTVLRLPADASRVEVVSGPRTLR